MASYLKQKDQLSAPDDPTTYQNWADLVDTVATIQLGNRGFRSDGEVMGVSEPRGIFRGTSFYNKWRDAHIDRSEGTDHLDHAMAGCAAIDVYNNILGRRDFLPTLSLFRGYDTILVQEPLTPERTGIKRDLFLNSVAGTLATKTGEVESLGNEKELKYYEVFYDHTRVQERVLGGAPPLRGCTWIGRAPLSN